MINRILYVSDKEMKEAKGNLEQDNETYVVEIEGEHCVYLIDYLDLISKLFQFPIKARGLDGYNDWMRDLSWIDKKQIIIIVNNYQQFLLKDIPSKEAILEDFNEIILPWWESDVISCVVGGETKKMLVYLVQ